MSTPMAGARSGPVYGDLPALDQAWAIYDTDDSTQLFTPEEARSLFLEILDQPVSYVTLHRLSMAMASTLDLNPAGVARIKQNAIYWHKHQEVVSEVRGQLPIGDLPLVEADVLKYSEEPLKQGQNSKAWKLAPIIEEMKRIEMRICLDLDVGTFGLDGTICCPGGQLIPGRIMHTTSVIRG